MNANEILQTLLKQVKDLGEEVKKNKTESGKVDEAAFKKRMDDVLAEKEKVWRNERVAELRKVRFEKDGDEDDDKKSLPELIVSKAKDEEHREFQKLNDRIYLCSKILRVHPTSLKMWNREMGRGPISELKKAMDTATAAEGAEWVPTGFSADLTDRVRMQFKIAGLFRHVPMPTNPFKLPVVSSDASAYLVPESTLDGTDTKITASTPGTRNLELSASKLASRVLYSEEMTEDSIVATADFVLDNLAIAMASGIENGVINGKISGAHYDSDVTSATDARKAFNGLRSAVLSGSKVDLNGSSFTTANLRTLRLGMGKYGLDPSKLVFITNAKGYKNFMGLAEVITSDKYGSLATVLSGELAKFDGVPIVLSEHIREDLGTTGAYDGTTTNRSIVLLVYMPTWVIGDRRKVTVKTWEDIERDQTVVVSTVRHGFGSLHDATTEKIVALGHNVA